MNASNIKIARPKVAGVFYSAATGTALPTDATTALSSFTELGFVGEAGIVQKINRSVTNLKDMGGNVVLPITTEHSVEYTLTPLEMTEAVLKEILGQSNVEMTTGSAPALKKASINVDELPIREYIFDMRLQGNELMRVVIPNGRITSVGDITFKAGEPIASQITITATPDATNNKAYYYFGTAV